MQNDDLATLIKAMNKTEKRYFTLYANSKHVKKGLQHLELFQSLQKQGPEIAGDSTDKKLILQKNALFKFILQAMRSYHSEKDLRRTIFNLVSEARFLSSKGLYSKSIKWLRKAEKLALKNEMLKESLDVQEELRSLLKERTNKNRNKVLSTSWDHSRAALHTLEVEYLLRETLDKIFHLGRMEFRLRTTAQIEALDKLVEETGKLQKEALQTTHARFLYCQVQALSFQLRGNYDQAYEWYSEAFALWKTQANPARITKLNYLLCMASLLQSSFMAQRYDQIEEMLAELREFRSESFNEQAEWFQNYYFYRLLADLNQENFQAGIALAREIEQGLQHYRLKINQARRISFYYNLGVAYFLAGQYSGALQWYRKITEASESENRMDLQQTVRIFSLICHLEEGNIDLCESLFRATYRHLQRRGRLHSFEKDVLTLLKRMIQAEHPKIERSTSEALLLLCREVETRAPKALPAGLKEIRWWTARKLKQSANV